MSGDSLVVRPYRPTDAEAVVAVHEEAFRASGMTFVADSAIDEELQDVTASYLDGGDTFLVGTVDGDVVATGGYRSRGDGVASGGYRSRGDGVAEVGHVRVHPDVQRRGCARAIMAELEERAAEEGIERFVLETHEDLVAAQALYEATGYEIDHTEPHPVTGEEMIHYAKDL